MPQLTIYTFLISTIFPQIANIFSLFNLYPLTAYGILASINSISPTYVKSTFYISCIMISTRQSTIYNFLPVRLFVTTDYFQHTPLIFIRKVNISLPLKHKIKGTL